MPGRIRRILVLGTDQPKKAQRQKKTEAASGILDIRLPEQAR